MTAFTVNVLLTCILNCDAGPDLLQLFASTEVDRFLSRVSYLPSDPTFFAGVVALLRESYTFVQRNSHVFLALSDRAYISGARSLSLQSNILTFLFERSL